MFEVAYNGLTTKMTVYAVRSEYRVKSDTQMIVETTQFLFYDDPSGAWVWADAEDFVPFLNRPSFS